MYNTATISSALTLLLLGQLLSGARSTRLPLEVYELTPPASAAEGAGAGAAAAAAAAAVKHKSLEYTVFDAKELAGAPKLAVAVALAASTAPTTTKLTEATKTTPALAAAAAATTTTTTSKPVNSAEQQLTVVSMSAELPETLAEGRRARQMLQGKPQSQQQQQHRFGFYDNNNNNNNNYNNNNNENNNKKHAHGKDVRILYQVGDSEDALPVCAPNAVCSKIDLYETPWIERQCRCPESNRMPNNIILHHHNAGHNYHAEAVEDVKYRSYYEKERLLQHKRLLLGEFNDKKFESLHMKKLMQKLGAVYEDDLHLQASDYFEQDYNDALPPPAAAALSSFDEYAADNELPHAAPRREFAGASSVAATAAHMRHSGHRGQKEPLSFIGGCPSNLGVEDGHTIADKTRHYKLCQPVHKLPVCKHFHDYTWTLTTAAELNVTEQIVHCRCPKNSVTYLTKREAATDGSQGFRYLFACSPMTRLRCQRKQPCKLFTVRKRQEFLDEVNINSLCQCPKGHRCPSHHTQSSVIAGESFLEDNIQTYSGYCMAND